MRLPCSLVVVAGALSCGLPAAADTPNLFLAKYGPSVSVVGASVSVRPGVYGKPQDNAARSFMAKRATPEQRSAVVLPSEPAAAGGAVAAWIGSTLLNRRLGPAAPAREVRVAVEVTRFDMRSSPALPGSEPLPIGDAKISFAVRITDAGDGRELANAVVDDCVVATGDMDGARDAAGLKYAGLGADIQFRMTAASMNAMARYVEAVLEAPQLPTGSKTVGSFALANGAVIKDVVRHPDIRITISEPAA